uniref:Uncharacterized protein n=2 Tax=Sipha flava TaxID=143950 RepID=A0A2S2QIM5_9HEMI
MVVLVGLVVILLLIVIIVIIILMLFVCKNRYFKPGNGTGGRQKYSRSGGGQQQDNDSNLGATGDSKAAFYENLPFHGMRPPPNQPYKPPAASGYAEGGGDMEYADVDYRTMYYGPINYKQSS